MVCMYAAVMRVDSIKLERPRQWLREVEGEVEYDIYGTFIFIQIK